MRRRASAPAPDSGAGLGTDRRLARRPLASGEREDSLSFCLHSLKLQDPNRTVLRVGLPKKLLGVQILRATLTLRDICGLSEIQIFTLPFILPVWQPFPGGSWGGDGAGSFLNEEDGPPGRSPLDTG